MVIPGGSSIDRFGAATARAKLNASETLRQPSASVRLLLDGNDERFRQILDGNLRHTLAAWIIVAHWQRMRHKADSVRLEPLADVQDVLGHAQMRRRPL